MADGQTGYEGRKDLLQNLYPILPAGSINLLAAASGVGKTSLYASWCRTWLDGKEWFGYKPAYEVPKIGVVMTDRRYQRARFWFDRAGVFEDERFQMYCLQDDYGLNWNKLRDPKLHLTAFKESLHKLGGLPPGSIVIIDPISPLLGNKLNDYSATAAAIGPLQQFIAQLGVTCLGTHHTSKLKQDKNERHVRPQDRILGSSALVGYTDTQFYIVGPEETEQPWALMGAVPHDSPPQEFKIMRSPDSGLFMFVGGSEAAAKMSKEEQAVMQAGNAQPVPDDPSVQTMLGFISPDGEGTKAAILFEQVRLTLELSPATIKRQLEKFVGWGWVVKPKYGYYRRLVTLGSDPQA